jgi:hypothetical protein
LNRGPADYESAALPLSYAGGKACRLWLSQVWGILARGKNCSKLGKIAQFVTQVGEQNADNYLIAINPRFSLKNHKLLSFKKTI